MRKPLVKPLTF